MMYEKGTQLTNKNGDVFYVIAVDAGTAMYLLAETPDGFNCAPLSETYVLSNLTSSDLDVAVNK